MQLPRLSKEEFSRRGHELYERIRSRIEEGNRGRIVAIDIQSGDFEVADDTLSASDRLLAKCPDALTWFERIGHSAVYRIGHGIVR